MKTLLPLIQFLVQNIKKSDLQTINNNLSVEERELFDGIYQKKYQTDIQIGRAHV